jgi:hypothetical protein
MRWIRPSSEPEMVALFLQQELASERFGPTIAEHLEREALPREIITRPDLTDAQGQAERHRLLRLHRGYGTEDGQYLSAFPTAGVRWDWAGITPDELRQVKYIDWSYWLELSGGSRLPTDAADRLRAGVRPCDVSTDRFFAMAACVAAGAIFPPLILVTAQQQGGLVVLEGHVRLTAYVLEVDALPPELEVLVGYSPAIARWPNY